jgi:hypothetical protein
MTVAAAALGAAVGGRARRPRLAAPGALLLLGGLVIMWWGLGIFRGDGGGLGQTKLFRGPVGKNALGRTDKPAGDPGGSGGGDARLS